MSKNTDDVEIEAPPDWRQNERNVPACELQVHSVALPAEAVSESKLFTLLLNDFHAVCVRQPGEAASENSAPKKKKLATTAAMRIILPCPLLHLPPSIVSPDKTTRKSQESAFQYFSQLHCKLQSRAHSVRRPLLLLCRPTILASVCAFELMQ